MHSRKVLLGVNVDHVATLRQARGTEYPDPVHAALRAVSSGADSITVHLREDRRHIQDHDVHRLKRELSVPLNLEMAATPAMVNFALQVMPTYCCIVPERREERTTEGGLDLSGDCVALDVACKLLQAKGIRVSLFINPDKNAIEQSAALGVDMVEFHTGCYADAEDKQRAHELARLQVAAHDAFKLGLQVNAGHGLHEGNVADVAHIPEITELNIGHAIIAQAVFFGIEEAVARMKRVMIEARNI